MKRWWFISGISWRISLVVANNLPSTNLTTRSNQQWIYLHSDFHYNKFESYIFWWALGSKQNCIKTMYWPELVWICWEMKHSAGSPVWDISTTLWIYHNEKSFIFLSTSRQKYCIHVTNSTRNAHLHEIYYWPLSPFPCCCFWSH